MNVLALDTAGPLPSVAVLARGAVVEEPLPADRQASGKLLSTATRARDRAGIALSDCDRIAVCSGPGSFTGLRVGLSTAWGLGRALSIPVEEVSTLEVLAEAAREQDVTRVTAVLDAGRGEVVAATFSLEQSRARPDAEARRIPREAAAALPGRVAALPRDLVGGRAFSPAAS